MAELLDENAIATALTDLPDWQRANGSLRRTWTFKGFNGAMGAANVVAFLANRANHHPDIIVHDYRQLTIITTTHDAGGITQNDLDLARRIGDVLG